MASKRKSENLVKVTQSTLNIHEKYPRGWGGGDLVVQGDVPVANFRVINSVIYYLLGSQNFQIYYRLGL